MSAGGIVLRVLDMTCEGCEATVREALLAVPGVTRAEADRNAKRATAFGDVGPADLPRLLDAVTAAGYDARPADG